MIIMFGVANLRILCRNVTCTVCRDASGGYLHDEMSGHRLLQLLRIVLFLHTCVWMEDTVCGVFR